jgi:hypothetical protein
MPEIKLFYKNCDCCGSGSSGSGSCSCGFIQAACTGSTECKTKFHVTINVNFANCGSTPFGSCSSGSGVSGLESGIADPDSPSESGSSGSEPCLSTCPSCCDLVASKYELDLDCYETSPGTWFLINDALTIDPANPSKCAEWGLVGAQDSCKGARDGCTYFAIGFANGNFVLASFATAIDGGMLFGFSDQLESAQCNSSTVVDSCNPLQISGNLVASASLAGLSNNPNQFNYLNMPCFGACLFPEGLETATLQSIEQRFCCISITFTITEALP